MKLKFVSSGNIKVDNTDEYDNKFAPILDQYISDIKTNLGSCSLDVNMVTSTRSLFKTSENCVNALRNHLKNKKITHYDYYENNKLIGFYVDYVASTTTTPQKNTTTNQNNQGDYSSIYDNLFGKGNTNTKSTKNTGNYDYIYGSLFGENLKIKEEIDRIKRIINN